MDDDRKIMSLEAERWRKAQDLARIVYDRDIQHASPEQAIEAIAEVIYYGSSNMTRLQDLLLLKPSTKK